MLVETADVRLFLFMPEGGAVMGKLKNYKPTRFMAKTSHYDKARADYVVSFIECLCHTKGRWAGKPFILMPWQERIIRDVFGILKPDGHRQFSTAYIEIPKKNGKSELAAAIALYLLFGDGEASPEVYGAAADRAQASIVMDVASQMVRLTPALERRSKILTANKRIACRTNNGFYQVLSAEVGTKHGLNVSGLVLDEVHAQPNRKLYDVLTKGSGDAREQPLYFLITTAGTDTNSICYELHQKAEDIIEGRKNDPTFYPVIYGAGMDEDWTDPKVWKKANPSLGETITMDKVRAACESAKQNPGEENSFRQLRLNQWVKQSVRWMPMDKWDACAFPADPEDLEGRVCYGGLDLSSTTDLTSFCLVFPPEEDDEPYYILPYFWLPEDTLTLRVNRDHVPYDVWERQGYIQTTEGNVVHYAFIEKFIEKLGEKYNIREIAFDRWGAVQMVQNLEGMGFTVVPMGQGFASMSPPTKELMKLTLEKKLAHGGHPVLRWNMDNIFIRTDPAGNIKADKAKSTEKIDGAIACIMALDRAIRCGNDTSESVYDTRGLLVF
jgi:phage terminase large subunit-like protein